MSKKYRLLIIVSILAIFDMAANIKFAKAEMLEIGDENIWIVVTASGTRGQVDVPIIITDPKGRRMGFDPRTEKWIIEFDASYDTGFRWDEEKQKYVPFCEGPVDLTDETEPLYYNDPKFREEFEEGTDCKTDVAFNLIPGDYIIETIGKGLTKYDATFILTRRIKGYSPKTSRISFDGVIDKDITSKFKITYTPDPVAEPGIGIRLATPSSLKQDITLSRKIDWLDNDGIMNSLLKKAEAIEASIAKGKNDTAKNQLNALVNEINAQKDKQIDAKAVKMLLEDVQYIVDQLK